MKVPLLLLACAAAAAAATALAPEGRPRKRLPLVSTDVIPTPEPGHTTDSDRPVKPHQQVAFWHPPGLEGPEPSNSSKCFHIRVSRRRGRRRQQRRRKEEEEEDSQPADPEDASDVLTVRKNRKHLIPSAFICTNRRKNRRRKGLWGRRHGKNSHAHAHAHDDEDSADEDVDGKTRRRRRLSHLALQSLRRETS